MSVDVGDIIMFFIVNAAMEIERLKTGYEQLQISSSAERFDLHDKIYKLRNELQDSKDHMAAEQIVLGPLNVKSCRCRST